MHSHKLNKNKPASLNETTFGLDAADDAEEEEDDEEAAEE